MVDPEAEIEETGSSTIELPSGLHVHVTRAFLDIGPGERWLRFLTIPEEPAKARAASRKIAELVGAHHVLYCADGMAHLWREGDASLRKPAGDLFYEGCNFDDVLAWIRSQDLPLWTEFPPTDPIDEDIDEKVVWILESPR